MRSVKANRTRAEFIAAAAGAVVLLAGQTAVAQYSSDFEALAPGVMTGQDLYYIPAGTTSVDFTVETYSKCPGACNFDTSTGAVCDIFDFLGFQDMFVNANPCACDMDTSTLPGVCDIFDFLAFQDGFVAEEFGIPLNPTGGSQYVKGVGPGGSTYARAQRDMVWPAGTSTFSFDILCATEGAPGNNNLGSFSIQPFPGSASLIHLFEWMPASTTHWRASMIGFSESNVQFAVPYPVPGPEWENLELNKWYRLTMSVDFTTNTVIKAAIADIDAGTSTSAAVSGVWLEGGAATPSPHPNGFRFFGGSTSAGNYTCWDNAEIN